MHSFLCPHPDLIRDSVIQHICIYFSFLPEDDLSLSISLALSYRTAEGCFISIKVAHAESRQYVQGNGGVQCAVHASLSQYAMSKAGHAGNS